MNKIEQCNCEQALQLEDMLTRACRWAINYTNFEAVRQPRDCSWALDADIGQWYTARLKSERQRRETLLASAKAKLTEEEWNAVKGFL